MPKVQGCDMIANLNTLPAVPACEGVRIKRAFPGDKETILAFVRERFSRGWVGECEHALMQSTPKCLIATKGGKVLGFACYDASALGFFGPIGVAEEARGQGIGAALLVQTLHVMRAQGYGYAIIGWVNDAEMFYRKTVGATFIEGGTPEKSVYSNLVMMD